MSGLWFMMFFGMLPLSLWAAIRSYDEMRSER